MEARIEARPTFAKDNSLVEAEREETNELDDAAGWASNDTASERADCESNDSFASEFANEIAENPGSMEARIEAKPVIAEDGSLVEAVPAELTGDAEFESTASKGGDEITENLGIIPPRDSTLDELRERHDAYSQECAHRGYDDYTRAEFCSDADRESGSERCDAYVRKERLECWNLWVMRLIARNRNVQVYRVYHTARDGLQKFFAECYTRESARQVAEQARLFGCLNGVPSSHLKPGHHIWVQRRLENLWYQHHAIYNGPNDDGELTVIHFYDTGSAVLERIRTRREIYFGRVQESSLELFRAGCALFHWHHKHEDKKARELALARAREVLKQEQVGWNPDSHNCEHFANFCYGRSQSFQSRRSRPVDKERSVLQFLSVETDEKLRRQVYGR